MIVCSMILSQLQRRQVITIPGENLCKSRPEDESTRVPYLCHETQAYNTQSRKARDLLDAGASIVLTGGPGNQLYRGEICIHFG
jgi:hypothetical protein